MNIGGMQKLSLCDYPGTPSIVIFLQGCNFDCPFCHNKKLLPYKSQCGYLSETEIFDYLNKRQDKIPGVVISGGEPTIQRDLHTFIGEIKSLGYKTKLDTNGSHPEDISNLLNLDLLDYVAMDVKAPWQKYDLLAGRKIEEGAIRESISCIAASGIPHHFRTTFYPAMLSDEDLVDIKAFLPKTSHHIVQQFVNREIMEPPDLIGSNT